MNSPALSKREIEIRRRVFENRTVVETRNQDLVAPAPYHMPIEVVSVRVGEHQHEERTPSGVVSWTVEERQRCTDEQKKISKSLSK